MKWTIGVILACGLLVSCANPSVVRVDSAGIQQAGITTVLVPRFEGAPQFVDAATDVFVAELESRIAARVVQAPALHHEGADVFAGGNIADPDLAIERAKATGAQVVVLGKVSGVDRGSTLNGFSTVRVVRVSDGVVVASFHRPSGLLVGNSAHHAVMAAVKRTAEDVAKALR